MSYENMSMTTNLSASGRGDQAGPVAFAGVILTTWGWIHLLLGLLVLAAGAGLFFGATWARTVAVIAACVSMLGNFAWLPNYPVWGLTLIALDVFVIWAVIVHGQAFVDE